MRWAKMVNGIVFLGQGCKSRGDTSPNNWILTKKWWKKAWRAKKKVIKKEILKSSPQYQKSHQNMLIILPMLDTDLQPCSWEILGWKLSCILPKHPIKKLACQTLITLSGCRCTPWVREREPVKRFRSGL